MDEVVLNDEAVMNDYGFYTLNGGLDLTRFRQNPVVLVNHDSKSLPIGRVDVETIRTDGTRLMAKVIWDETDTDKETQRLIAKYKSGFMKGFSIGMVVLKMQDFGVEGTPQYKAVKAELYELSAVTLPSNKNAVCLMNKTNALIELQRGAALITLGFDKEGHIFLNNKIEDSQMVKSLKLLGLAADTSDDALHAQLSTLMGKAAAMETHRIEAALISGRANGVVTDLNAPNYRAMLTADFDNTFAILSASKPVATTASTPDAPVTMTALMAEFKKLESGQATDPNDRSQWTMTDWMKKDQIGLGALKMGKPTEYAALLAKHRAANGF